jgi:hypothetical protein
MTYHSYVIKQKMDHRIFITLIQNKQCSIMLIVVSFNQVFNYLLEVIQGNVGKTVHRKRHCLITYTKYDGHCDIATLYQLSYGDPNVFYYSYCYHRKYKKYVRNKSFRLLYAQIVRNLDIN